MKTRQLGRSGLEVSAVSLESSGPSQLAAIDLGAKAAASSSDSHGLSPLPA